MHLGSHLYPFSSDTVVFEHWLLGLLVESSVECLAGSILWSHFKMGDKDGAGGYCELQGTRDRLPNSSVSTSTTGIYMTCGRENAAAVDIENGGSLCVFEPMWAHHPTTGVSGCFGAGATTAVTASLRRLAKVTTSSTPARPLTNSAHSYEPNKRQTSARAWPLTSWRGLLFIL